MKFRQLIAAFALATTGATFAADNHAHGHEHKPLHDPADHNVFTVRYAVYVNLDCVI